MSFMSTIALHFMNPGHHRFVQCSETQGNQLHWHSVDDKGKYVKINEDHASGSVSKPFPYSREWLQLTEADSAGEAEAVSSANPASSPPVSLPQRAMRDRLFCLSILLHWIKTAIPAHVCHTRRTTVHIRHTYASKLPRKSIVTRYLTWRPFRTLINNVIESLF